MGDPAGIGPEITLKAWARLKEQRDHIFAVIAPLSVMEDAAERLGMGSPMAITDLGQCTKVFGIALPVLDQGRTGAVSPGTSRTSRGPSHSSSTPQGSCRAAFF